jgi:GT2 family glycosyltransferase
MPDIGIIIVTYNSAAFIGACLDAAVRTGAEIVVVDNASTDRTRDEVERRGVRLIANPKNLGFAAAVNQGFRLLNATRVLLLNPDAVLVTSLDSLSQACDEPRAAGAGGKLLDALGRPQAGFMVRKFPTPATLILESLLLNRVWPGNPVNTRYRCLKLDHSIRQPVDQPAGAFLMLRREVWQELGGFDETFWPLWFEDVDFCRRASERGYRFYYEPNAVANHTGAHSIPALTVEMRRIYWYRSLLSYTVKHFSPASVRAVCAAVITGSFLRAVAESAQQKSFRPFAGCREVAKLAGRLLFGLDGRRIASLHQS